MNKIIVYFKDKDLFKVKGLPKGWKYTYIKTISYNKTKFDRDYNVFENYIFSPFEFVIFGDPYLADWKNIPNGYEIYQYVKGNMYHWEHKNRYNIHWSLVNRAYPMVSSMIGRNVDNIDFKHYISPTKCDKIEYIEIGAKALSPKVQNVVNDIIEQLKNGKIIDYVAASFFPKYHFPSQKYSLFNRTLIAIRGSADARGFRQWQEVGRHVKKGESSQIYIFVPKIKKITKKDEITGEEYKEPIVMGFFTVPLFDAKQTEGEPLDYETIELPVFPLRKLAEKWGIKVSAIGNLGQMWLGYYAPSRKEIVVASPDTKVFFHELAHVAHGKVKGSLVMGQNWKQEVVADFTSNVLMVMFGLSGGLRKDVYNYIQTYSAKSGKSMFNSLRSVISEVEQVLSLIETESMELYSISQ